MLGLLVLSGPVTTVPLLFFGAAAATFYHGHPPVPLADPAIPASGSGLRGAVLLGPTAELRLHLDSDLDLRHGLPPHRTGVPDRGRGAGLSGDR